ncbi:MAG: phosphatase PAP2 family protein [Odoribacter sp.]|nr:phosphatase PAP2 family protein [Odoribacter sp.]
MKKVAYGVSYLLHPLLIPLYGLYFIFNSHNLFSFLPGMTKNYCYLITLVFTCILPLICLPVFKKMDWIKSYHLDLKHERVYPVVAAILFSFVGFYFIGRYPFTNIVLQLYLALIVVLSGFAIITLKWKMSMHMTAMGAICAFLMILGIRYFGNVRYLFMLTVLFAGLLASSRLYLQKHTPAQVYTGFAFGLTFVLTVLL